MQWLGGDGKIVTVLCAKKETAVFKWIKQHLRIKRLFGTSENAVKTRIWIAVSVYVLVAIVKKRLDVNASLYTLLQILSVTLFEKMSLQQAFSERDFTSNNATINNQPNLFAFYSEGGKLRNNRSSEIKHWCGFPWFRVSP